jgi:hypothetical protein
MLNKDHLPLLRKARELIDNCTFTYICRAIGAAVHHLGQSYWMGADVINVINVSLTGIDYGGYSPRLEFWLAAQLSIPWVHLHDDTLRLARLAWLDKLIWDIEHAE